MWHRKKVHVRAKKFLVVKLTKTVILVKKLHKKRRHFFWD